MKFAILTAAILAAFAVAEHRGVTLIDLGHKAPPAPASVRSSPGGYRSYHFWHTGFHGGK